MYEIYEIENVNSFLCFFFETSVFVVFFAAFFIIVV